MRGSIAVLIIFVAGLAAHFNAFRAAFVYDDQPAILNNPEVRSFPAALHPSTPFTAARPVPVLSFGANYFFTGFDPISFHATNLLIHLLTAATLFGLVRRTFVSPRLAGPFAPHATLLALAAGLLFVTHPLTTEVVDYALQRTESMMALFALLTLYCLARALSDYARLYGGAEAGAEPEQHRSRHRHRHHHGRHGHRRLSRRPKPTFWFTLAVACCFVAMGCKQPAYAIPLIAVAYHRVFFAPTWGAVFRLHRWFYLALFATWFALAFHQIALTSYSSIGLSSISLSGGTPGELHLTPWTYLLTQSTVLCHYLRLILYPHPLVIDYGDWPVATSLLSVLPYALFIAALVIASFYALIRRASPIGFVGAAVFLVLAPTSSVLPIITEFAAERRVYLPLALLIPLAVAGVYLLAQRAMARLAVSPSSPLVRKPLWIAAAVLLAFLAPLTVLSIRRSAAYASPLTLWADTVAHRPADLRALSNLAAARIDAGDAAGAIAPLERALLVNPNFATARRNLATAHFHLGHTSDAIREYRLALKVADDALTNLYLGNALLAADQPAEALPILARAVALAPADPAAHEAYGQALFRLHQVDPALDQLIASENLDPDRPITAYYLGEILVLKKQPAAAIAAFHHSLDLDHEQPHVLLRLAQVLTTGSNGLLGNPAEAVSAARHAVNLTPTPVALEILAQAQTAAGDYDGALQSATQARAAATQVRAAATSAPTTMDSTLLADIDQHLAQLRSHQRGPTTSTSRLDTR